MPKTVLIVDDHAGFRGFARRLLEAGGYTVVGEAPDAASAIAAVQALQPELVLLDVLLPDTDGIAVAELLAENDGGPEVVPRVGKRWNSERGSSAAERAASSARTT